MKKRNSYDNKSTISEDTANTLRGNIDDLEDTTNENFNFDNLNITLDDENYDTYDDYSDIYVDDEYPIKKKKIKHDTIPRRYKRYNIRIILMNILFLCISLISIFSLLFMPFAKLDIKLDNATITNAVDNVYDTQLEPLIGDYIKKDDIKTFTQDMSLQFGKMSFKSIDFLKFGIDKDLSKTKKILTDYITTNLQQPVTTLIDQASKSIMALSTKMAISMIAGKNINLESEQFENLSLELNNAFEILQKNEADSIDKATITIMNGSTFQSILNNNGMSDLDTQLATLNQIKTILTSISKYGQTADGQFSMNTVIVNLDKVLTDIKNSQSTTYSLRADNSIPTNTTDNIIDNFIQNISDLTVLVDNIVDTLTAQQKQLLSYGIFTFGLFTCISAAVWACLAVTIVVRFFFKRKAVSLWAVIWLGGLQAIWMLPALAISIFNLTHIVKYVSYTWISLAASLLTMVLYFILYRKPKIATKHMHNKSYI